MILVRDALLSDLDTLVDFNLRLAQETEAKALHRDTISQGVRTALDHPDRLRYWVAVSAETRQVIGQAAVTREWSDWRNGWIWWFQSVYVPPESRAQSVFRTLHSHIRAAALAEPDVVGLRLYVEQANLRAQKTYQSLGLSHAGYQVHEEIWPL